MIEMNLNEAAAIAGHMGALAASNKSFTGISIDTRTLMAGNLFVAIPGTSVDGHDFIEMAFKKNAAAALVTRKIESPHPQLQVADTIAALGKLGAAWRNQFNIPFIAITGSNGKTTLKNMVASILTAACQGDGTRVLANQRSFNNHLGLPLTLAQLNNQHRFAVTEMGMNHFGEIKYLTNLTHPQVAIITNAAACHLEGVGDIAGVARAKGEIFSGMTQNGVAILNRDDTFFSYWLEQIGSHSYITFGFHPDADVRATIHEKEQTLHTPEGDTTLTLPLLGRHNIHNMLAATAAAIALSINLPAIKTGLEAMLPAPGRLKLHTLANGVNIIDDTYNANPFSLEAAINTLTDFSGKKILVLADMKELGPDAKIIHQAAGNKIRDAGIDTLFTFGELSANTACAFGEGAFHFNDQEKLVTALKPFLYNQTTILVKGSRSMRMEKVVAGLTLDQT
jgi:UDP-N-acetylmuramoyl-tripeptide--D-alanyl-D-alanine ligase